MAVPTITPLPEAPNRSTDSPSMFSSKADAWADAVVDFVPEANTLASFANTKASEADTSATNAANSESAAATSETNAANSESAAATSESNAATSETNAANSESAAATSESNAATSANNAATDAGVAQSAANTAVEAASAVASSVSTTSLNVSTGAKSLTVDINAGFISGATIEIIYRADSSIVLSGTVTSYNASSGALDVDITSVSGSGTFSDWVVRVPLTVENLNQSGAASGEVLQWNGSQWTPGGLGAGDVGLGNVLNEAQIAQGKHTIGLPAAAWTARATDGAEQATIEFGTNNLVLVGYDFDAATEEAIQVAVPMPVSSDESAGLTAIVGWTETAGNSGDVVWGLSALALGDNDAIDSALGTEVTVTDTRTAQGDLMQTAETATITPAGTWAAGDLVLVQLARKAGNGSDTLGGDARFVNLRLFYTINAGNDA